MSPHNRFYVYEHWRPDKDVCFWVGKGAGDRAYIFKRNPRYDRIVAKLARLGMCVEVRLVAESLAEDRAFLIERERIAFWRSAGDELSNVTDGGEGVSGLKHRDSTKRLLREQRLGKKNPSHSAKLKGRKHSASHREAIARGNTGKVLTQETRDKISNRHRGRVHTEETKRKFSESHKGKRHPPETLAKMSLAQTQQWQDPLERAKRQAYKTDPERRAKWIESLRAKPPASDEHRRKLSEAAKADWARRKAKGTEAHEHN